MDHILDLRYSSSSYIPYISQTSSTINHQSSSDYKPSTINNHQLSAIDHQGAGLSVAPTPIARSSTIICGCGGGTAWLTVVGLAAVAVGVVVDVVVWVEDG
jgi:hypothetical protein